MNANFHNVVGTQSIQQYIYDRNGNRLSRTNLIDAAFSESYSYESLNQLTGFTRGEHSRL
ncbi:MAG: hypothetical protein KatS3mg107_1259 [Gemmataceae bacterium]|nr:MAG: hypothetical protein KatS3mg107_1259 [Gemmataceae bacterium]